MTRYLDGIAQGEVAVWPDADRLVTLVDVDDRMIGAADKLVAHRSPGLLHRSFSVMLVDRDDHVVLQQRSSTKFLFPSLWSNSCCGHPGPAMSTIDAARRRVRTAGA